MQRNSLLEIIASLTPEQLDLVRVGKVCPKCNTANHIKCVGSNPDGRAMNYTFDCLKCGAQWEGD